jgi:hypothetical protein
MNIGTMALRQSGWNLKLTVYLKLAGCSTIRKSQCLQFVLHIMQLRHIGEFTCLIPLVRIRNVKLSALHVVVSLVCLFRL